MKAIIPIHDDFTHITEFQTVLAEHKSDVLFVFDRCKPPEGFDWNYKIHEDPRDCFLAGKVRSFGASFCDDDICFFDQDKVPTKDPFKIVPSILAEHDTDCILFFTENDFRNDLFAKKEFAYLTDVVCCTDYLKNYVYTSGIWISKKAKDAVTQLNSGTLFAPAFDGVWGQEDEFLGDELLALGFKISVTQKLHTSETPVGCMTGDRMSPLINQISKRIQLRACISNKFAARYLIVLGEPYFNTAFSNIAALSLKRATNDLINNFTEYLENDDGKQAVAFRKILNELAGEEIKFRYSEKQEDA